MERLLGAPFEGDLYVGKFPWSSGFTVPAMHRSFFFFFFFFIFFFFFLAFKREHPLYSPFSFLFPSYRFLPTKSILSIKVNFPAFPSV